ncbi:MAG TPA: nicotinate-nucleotide diphosphorylase (carboxylating), partial [Thermoanaerobaculia bacterium]|nr:nicotinate-nucleotide diphosphorylase (carboxylating) [Thermoanaerobaculia bacterium]
MRPAEPLLATYEGLLRRALAEDLGTAGDLTTDAVVPAGARAIARLVARRPGRIAGLGPALAVFHLLAPEVEIERRAEDGDDVEEGALLARIAG